MRWSLTSPRRKRPRTWHVPRLVHSESQQLFVSPSQGGTRSEPQHHPRFHLDRTVGKQGRLSHVLPGRHSMPAEGIEHFVNHMNSLKWYYFYLNVLPSVSFHSCFIPSYFIIAVFWARVFRKSSWTLYSRDHFHQGTKYVTFNPHTQSVR